MLENEIIRVENARKYFYTKKGLFSLGRGQAIKAVDDVSFSIRRGERFGLVGESGCGKTTSARMILRIEEPTGGRILYRMKSGEVVDIAELERAALNQVRLEMQMVFQDPFSSLNPRMTVLENLSESMIVHGLARASRRREIVGELLTKVGLKPEYMSRYPHAFSGGQRQRIAIARALTVDPSVILCDESVSALDVSVQAQILNLLEQLGHDFGLTYLFIAHDLSVVYHFCDRVAVMYLGEIVELADTYDLFDRPRHPYTEALLSATPIADPDSTKKRILLAGDVPSAINRPSGCPFHPRCAHAIDVCTAERPELVEKDGRKVACHRADELTLAGAFGDEEAV